MAIDREDAKILVVDDDRELADGLSCLYHLSRPFRLIEKHALSVLKRARREGGGCS